MKVTQGWYTTCTFGTPQETGKVLSCRLETFNSVIYHQLNENPHLVYAILRAHQDFQSLATFTLVSGLREIQRRKSLRSQGEALHAPDCQSWLTNSHREREEGRSQGHQAHQFGAGDVSGEGGIIGSRSRRRRGQYSPAISLASRWRWGAHRSTTQYAWRR